MSKNLKHGFKPGASHREWLLDVPHKKKNEVDKPKQKGKTIKEKCYMRAMEKFNLHSVNVQDLRLAVTNLIEAYEHRQFLGSICVFPAGQSDEDAQENYIERTETIRGVLKMLKNIKTGESQTKKEEKNGSLEAQPTMACRIEKLRVICWDLGNHLSIKYLCERMTAVADFIEREKFDIILLQNVNPISARYLKVRLAKQYKFSGRILGPLQLLDITYTLTRYESVDFISTQIIYFQETDEKRCLLGTWVKIGSEKLYIMNTNLDSKKENSSKRIQQMQKCFKVFQSVEEKSSVIFGGNLNIRELETDKIGVSEDLLNEWDLWVGFGREDNKFTWDLRVNKIIQIIGIEVQPCKRFDRMYFRKSSAPLLKPVFFDLCGKEIVAAMKYCISDHFGIITEFQVSPDCYLKPHKNVKKLKKPVSLNL